MTFELVPVPEIFEYLQKHVSKEKDKERRLNAKYWMRKIASGEVIAFFGFKNEYGEKYLCVGTGFDNYMWCGDESDWDGAWSYGENSFIREMMIAEEAKIISLKVRSKKVFNENS